MIILIKLLLAHLIGDFIFQPNKWVTHKQKNKLKSHWLYIHVLIHGGLTLLFLFDLSYWLLAVIVTLVHLIIDVIKLYGQKQSNKPIWFLVDQGLHLISLLVLFCLWFKPELDFYEFIQNTQLWLIALALVVVTFATSIAIRALLQNWTKEVEKEATKKGSLKRESLERAGTYIGILERLFVFIFIITGNWAPVGFLLAAKSVFRFGDLSDAKNRKLTEYVLIGTLLSFGIAILVGIAYLYLINLLN